MTSAWCRYLSGSYRRALSGQAHGNRAPPTKCSQGRIIHIPKHCCQRSLPSTIAKSSVFVCPARFRARSIRHRGASFTHDAPRKIGAICEQREPPLSNIDARHAIRCHIPAADLARLQTGIAATVSSVRALLRSGCPFCAMRGHGSDAHRLDVSMILENRRQGRKAWVGFGVDRMPPARSVGYLSSSTVSGSCGCCPLQAVHLAAGRPPADAGLNGHEVVSGRDRGADDGAVLDVDVPDPVLVIMLTAHLASLVVATRCGALTVTDIHLVGRTIGDFDLRGALAEALGIQALIRGGEPITDDDGACPRCY